MKEVRIGCSGWNYDDWNGVLYPPGVASRDRIAHYARVFDTVEIDSTFYGTPPETYVRHWAQATPEAFRFCPKVPRLITHDLGLKDVAEPLAAFVKTMSLLGPKRGPMLIQLPPSFTRAELPTLKAFLPTLQALDDPTARFAIEFRHRSLIGPEVSALLQAHHIALVANDYPYMPRRFEVTTDFVYVRLVGQHGAFNQYYERQADRLAEITHWANALRTQRDRFAAAYILCNNDYEGYAPETCNRFLQQLGLPNREKPPEIQGSLF